jgi:type VI secretion system protein ImpC
MNIQFTVDNGNPSERPGEERPINILLVGNFSGRDSESTSPTDSGQGFNIFHSDGLDADEAVARLSPKARIHAGGEIAELTFSSMDDFHPDAIYSGYPAFAFINELKRALQDPARSSATAVITRQLLGWEQVAVQAPKEQPSPESAKPAGENQGDMFSRLLGQAPPGPDQVSNATRKLLEQAVASDLAPQSSPDVENLRDGLNVWCEAAMRELLRTPEFRGLEANWRSFQWLGENIEFGEEANLWLVDAGSAPPSAWANGLKPAINRKLAGEPVDLIIALYEFSDSSESMADLRSLMDAAGQLGAPILSGAHPDLAGLPELRGTATPPFAIDAGDIEDSASDEWQALRAEPGATRIGLGFPRLLLRQPYGARSDGVDSFPFEELEARPHHESFAWGNPAIALAVIWLEQLTGTREDLQVVDLPMVMYDDGGGQAIKPPSELYLSDSAAEKLLEMGLMPFVGQRGQTGVRLPRLQSIAKPVAALKA